MYNVLRLIISYLSTSHKRFKDINFNNVQLLPQNIQNRQE